MAPRRRANCQICNEHESKYACPVCEVLYCSVSCYKQHKSRSLACGASAGSGPVYNTDIVSRPSDINTDTANARIGVSHNSTHDDARDADAKGRLPAVSDEPSLSVSDAQEGDGSSARGSMAHVRQGEELDVIGETSYMGAKTESGDVEMQTQTQTNATQKSHTDADEIILDAPNRPLRKLSSLKWPYIPDAPSYPDPLTRDDPKPLSLAQYEAIARSPAIRRALSAHERLPALLRSLDALRGPARERALERTLGVAPSQASFSLAGLPASSRHRAHGEEVLASEVAVDEEDMRALRALAEAVEAVVRDTGSVDGRFGSDPLGLDWEGMEA